MFMIFINNDLVAKNEGEIYYTEGIMVHPRLRATTDHSYMLMESARIG